MRSFAGYLGAKSPELITSDDIQQYLSYLAVERKVSTSTQNQALNALVFFYREVLNKELGEHELDAVRANYKRRLPVVLARNEIQRIFEKLSGTSKTMAMISELFRNYSATTVYKQPWSTLMSPAKTSWA